MTCSVVHERRRVEIAVMEPIVVPRRVRLATAQPVMARGFLSFLVMPIVRLCAWLATALGAEFFCERQECVGYKSVSLDGCTLLERIQLSKHNMQLLWNREAKYIVCGLDVSRDLFDLIDFQTLGRVPVELVRGQGRQVFGMQVVVVPWIEGALLLPELGKFE